MMSCCSVTMNKHRADEVGSGGMVVGTSAFHMTDLGSRLGGFAGCGENGQFDPGFLSNEERFGDVM